MIPVSPSTSIRISFTCLSDGEATDMDAPGGIPDANAVMYRNGTASGIAVTVTSAGETGRYWATATLPALGDDLALGDTLHLIVQPVIDGDPSDALPAIWEAILRPTVPDVHVASIGPGLLPQPLDAQQTRDSLKLAPTAGTPAAGSVDALIGSRAAPGDQMDLVNAPNATAVAAIATAVEAAILDEGDATPLLAAIAAKIEEFLINDGDATATLQAIASAVRVELAAELGRVDASISSRLPADGYSVPPSTADVAAGVWGHESRTLTSGANIALAKGTGITGLNDLDAAGVRNAILNRVLSGNHDTPGTAGKLLQDATAAVTNEDHGNAALLEAIGDIEGGGSAESVSVASIEPAALAQLQGIELRVKGPTYLRGRPIVLFRGADYSDAIGNVITFTLANPPDLTDATALLLIAREAPRDMVFHHSFSGTIEPANDTDWTIRFAITRHQLEPVRIGQYRLRVDITLSNGDVWTPVLTDSAPLDPPLIVTDLPPAHA